ncbi:hypothetical protein GCM10009799_28210 [Nocardiopsis rhodophaea]|uniref:CopG family transcriptional regulator n=1 Tax=Nocardiopsis rhodophaea TaxID=280238 RepID=A0ABP5EID7_9ACTN
MDEAVQLDTGTEKLSATVPKGLSSAIRDRAGKGHVSAYVTEALLEKIERDRLTELVDDLSDEFGAPTEDEVAAALAEWDDA